MIIIKNTTEFYRKNTVVSIGKFDGVHTGHMALLEEIRKAKKEGMETVIFTFSPSFSSFFSGKVENEIFSLQEKEEYFEQMGIDVLIEYPLNQTTVNISADEFIEDILVKKLDAKKIIAGEDVSFGKGGIGNGELLALKGPECGFETILVQKVCYHGMEISSTRIRDEIREGNMPLANQLLGDLYGIRGIVQTGKQIGRTIGFPTLNIVPEEGKLLPKEGVYFSEVQVRGTRYYGITNIGKNPTVTDENKIFIETHVFHFNDQVYGEEIEVYPVHFHRSELKFNDVIELKLQIEDDRLQAMKYFQILED